ncbi:hypothetical protein ANCDUO_17792 [Ancylostoma duodenale]|uniref:Uncharacterized protein n=1 Tax=Ancylostoma duodenale TaxID=51022 RepID=A0A0C2C746_9BILA|nr:hypothetical protein ANCDUO_17792 [Ancylostoma duodenale]
MGVVDSEDIPLNLSREMLQNNPVLRKLRKILTDKVLSFLLNEMKKDSEKYEDFYKQYSIFLKEGIVTQVDHSEKEEIAKLMLFESSNLKAGVLTNLPEYCKRMQEDQKEIYYMFSPSRQLAESSPYYELVRSQNKEVLFLYEPADEVIDKYSYFVAAPILLNGERVNSLNAIWTLQPKDVTKEMHETFFKQLAKQQKKSEAFQRPCYTIHYKVGSSTFFSTYFIIRMFHSVKTLKAL